MAHKWMTAEANAAIEGALEAGATEVVVADSHSAMRNLLPDELHEDALLVRGSPRPGIIMEDHIWMYPHKNELIKSNADETQKIATIARELGRGIATPAQARDILGIG